ncbi:hypothetical protein SDC9_118667 [bioreactor metagenome]|uniref:Uncharacterized protein n=1 Tax=bioreactor metagenome TaxID=1076179 RepID=A0A645C3B3_9ZZZZ
MRCDCLLHGLINSDPGGVRKGLRLGKFDGTACWVLLWDDLTSGENENCHDEEDEGCEDARS